MRAKACNVTSGRPAAQVLRPFGRQSRPEFLLVVFALIVAIAGPVLAEEDPFRDARSAMVEQIGI